MVNHEKHEFKDIFIELLEDIYNAEMQLIEAMPQYLKVISSPDLTEKLKEHFGETKKQKTRLDKIFKELKITPSKHFCEGMNGLLMECDKMAKKELPGAVKDAALISYLQKVEHYEIASYGTLRTFAKDLELDHISDILQEILDEEWKADQTLSKLAEGGWFFSGINISAVR